jgi:hypothetical protein
VPFQCTFLLAASREEVFLPNDDADDDDAKPNMVIQDTRRRHNQNWRFKQTE